MRDNPDHHEPHDGEEAPMTLLAVNGGYWVYAGEEYLNDLLFGRGTYPFRVKCLQFESAFDVNRFTKGNVSITTLWRVNPDVIERLRRENLLIEISPTEPE
ncbi:MAG: hypothetical protein ACK5M4_11845 [Pseudorhodobacter sp.]